MSEETIKPEETEPTPEEAGYRMDTDENENAMAMQVVTAFVVYVEPNGNAVGTNDLSVVDRVAMDRPADAGDMYRACMEVAKDVQASQIAQLTAQVTIQGMMQASQQMAEMVRNQKMTESLMRNKHPQHMKVPGR